MTSRFWKRTSVAALAAAGVAAGFGTGSLAHAAGGAARAAPAEAPPAPAAAPSPGLSSAPPDFAAIVQRYGPAVVNVSTTGTVRAALPGGQPGPTDPDDPLAPFLRRFGVPEGRGGAIARGLGSGFIVKSDGVVLTNAHVVKGASEVTVKLTDKREFKARVVGVDDVTDVAVLKIDATGLPTVAIGDPSRTRVGEWVLAIGAPFGFENSATAGIVSARGRSLPEGGWVPFLQTDVAVNPGNSGGPLFDGRGEVIGINSQIYSQSGGYMGLSFAIPIDVAMKVEGQLLAHGKVTRGRLGITIQELNQGLADSFGLPRATGALVSSVEKDGPAARAGVEPGDVILAIDGKPVAAASDLPARVAELEPGQRAKLEIWRDRKSRVVEVPLAPSDAPRLAQGPGGDEGHGRLGLAVRPLTREEQAEVGAAGLVVEDASGPAARAGVQPGDVLLAVNGQPVTSVERLRAAVDGSRKHVALLVGRGGARLFVPVDIG